MIKTCKITMIITFKHPNIFIHKDYGHWKQENFYE